MTGSIYGPDSYNLYETDYEQTYNFLATATAMVGATTITSDARTFTFYIPEMETYQVSPN